MRFSPRNNPPAPELDADGGGGVATLDPPAETEPVAAVKSESFASRILHFELTKGKVKRKELMHFSRQLAVFIKAGIPILEALAAITEEMGAKRFREVLQSIAEDLRRGATLADATDQYPDVFPSYYRGILRSAELTGNLDVALLQLSGYIERDLEAKRKVVSALVYPGIVVMMAITVVVVLATFVLPRFETFFNALNAHLPLATRILLSVTHFISHWWYAIIGSFVALVVAFLIALRTDRGRYRVDAMLLRMPIIGPVVQHALLERFCRVLSSMMAAGVALTSALNVTTDAVSNRVYRRGLDTAREAMLRGEGLARPLAATGLFPAAARQMFIVGESTGSLDEQLQTAAEYFERELDYKIKRLTTIFEPAVLIFVGVVVGFVAIALVSAMYGIFRQVHP